MKSLPNFWQNIHCTYLDDINATLLYCRIQVGVIQYGVGQDPLEA